MNSWILTSIKFCLNEVTLTPITAREWCLDSHKSALWKENAALNVLRSWVSKMEAGLIFWPLRRWLLWGWAVSSHQSDGGCEAEAGSCQSQPRTFESLSSFAHTGLWHHPLRSLLRCHNSIISGAGDDLCDRCECSCWHQDSITHIMILSMIKIWTWAWWVRWVEGAKSNKLPV